jgi:hypothetical protein
MLFTIALMFGQPDASSGRARASTQRPNISTPTSSHDPAALSAASETNERGRAELAADVRQRAVDAQSPDATGAIASQSPPGSSRSRADESAAGVGAAQSDDAATVAALGNDDRNTSATAAVQGERDAVGGGGRSLAGESGESVAAGIVRPADTSRTAPWQRAGWRDDQAAAVEALRARSVPDAYRDVIRAYFDVEDKRTDNGSTEGPGTR